jgi:hypothetical protein
MRGADVLVSGGTVVTPDSVFRADVLVTGGRIAKVGGNLTAGGTSILDAAGLFVLPGAIDGHVHMRDPGLTEKEDFSSGTAAAAAAVPLEKSSFSVSPGSLMCTCPTMAPGRTKKPVASKTLAPPAVRFPPTFAMRPPVTRTSALKTESGVTTVPPETKTSAPRI